ncbi:MAG: hypothetical protein ABS35_39725 [Kaistia sp. SCN 65-12]|nr:MAG: hypothetical protein ABS35_39725 [Kaistia sp. SCN 65-12]
MRHEGGGSNPDGDQERDEDIDRKHPDGNGGRHDPVYAARLGGRPRGSQRRGTRRIIATARVRNADRWPFHLALPAQR